MSREKQNEGITEIERMAYEMERLFIEAEINQTLPKKHPSIVKAEALYNASYRKQEWISVDDRLPEPYVSVLVYMPDEIPHPTVREGFINMRGEWYAGGFDRLPDEVVSWMEMPEAPKMKGGEE